MVEGLGPGLRAAGLEKLGVTSTTVDLASADPGPSAMADDAATIRAGLVGLGAPAVVVGHSYAGVLSPALRRRTAANADTVVEPEPGRTGRVMGATEGAWRPRG